MRLLLYLFICLSTSWSSTYNNAIPKNFQKKINKLLKKNFGNESINIEAISLSIPDKSFYYLRHEKELLGIMVIAKAHGCHVGGCDVGQSNSNAKYEDFWYVVIFDLESKIKAIKILEYESEYGYEICSKNWLKHFQGHTGCELKYGSKQIDAISGATVSGQSIVTDINNLCWLLQDFSKWFSD